MALNPITGRESRLDALARSWLAIKAQEENARLERIQIEEEMIESARFAQREGSQTIKSSDYSVTFTARVNRSVDPGAWEAIRERIPANLWPVRYKPEPIPAALKSSDLAPYRALVATAISEKPGKVGVDVKEVER